MIFFTHRRNIFAFFGLLLGIAVPRGLMAQQISLSPAAQAGWDGFFKGLVQQANQHEANLVHQNLHLTVRPHTMATATRTQRVDTLKWVYVPQQCLGTQRCPLLVHSNADPENIQHMADKDGIIMAEIWVGEIASDDPVHDVTSVDRKLKTVLQTFAIDPDKIAILGGSATGASVAQFALQNPDVFSRVVLYTQHGGYPNTPPRKMNQTTEYYISGGVGTTDAGTFARPAKRLRALGYLVKYSVQFREHGTSYEDMDYVGHWLQETWAIPNPMNRPVPYFYGLMPLLTVDNVVQMTDFWTRFMQLPDSIRTAARRAHVREVILPIGQEQISTLMTDMTALATQCPSVASALKAAGLTPQQHDEYRIALMSAHLLDKDVSSEIIPVKKTSPEAQNAALLDAHPDEYKKLSATGMWVTP